MRRGSSASFGVVLGVLALALFAGQNLAEQVPERQVAIARERCSLRSSALSAPVVSTCSIERWGRHDDHSSRKAPPPRDSSSTHCNPVLVDMHALLVNRTLSSSPTVSPDENVLVELVGLIVIFGECITLAACLVDWIAVQVPGFALRAAPNVLGLVVGGFTAAAHHLLFTGWYLQWFPESNVYLLAPLLQLLLSCSTAVIYASAMRQLAELQFERHRQAQLSRRPPRARFC